MVRYNPKKSAQESAARNGFRIDGDPQNLKASGGSIGPVMAFAGIVLLLVAIGLWMFDAPAAFAAILGVLLLVGGLVVRQLTVLTNQRSG